MRSFKPIAVLALVLAALGAYVFFVERKKPAEPEAEAKPKVFDVAADKVVELMVRSGNDRTVVRKVNGEWRVVEPIQAKADEAEVSGVTSSLASLENVRVVDETPSDLGQYGLSKPSVEIGFRTDGEKTMRYLRLGEKTPTQGELYASRGGRQVFLVPSYLESSFAKSTFDLRDKSVLTFARDKVDRLAIEGGPAPTLLVKSGADWALKSPTPAPADYGAVEGLIARLETARMTSLVEQQGGDLGRYGLDKPALSVTVGAGSSQASLQIGSKAENGYYARDASRPLLFVVESSLVDELKKPSDDLRNKDVFAFRPFNAAAIELTRGTETIVLEKAKGSGKDADEKWRRVKPSAGDVDQSKVDDVLSRLSNLRAESFQPPDSAAAQALASSPVLVVTARQGEDRKQETVRFARLGADVYAGVTGQPGPLKVPAADFNGALKAIDALK